MVAKGVIAVAAFCVLAVGLTLAFFVHRDIASGGHSEPAVHVVTEETDAPRAPLNLQIKANLTKSLMNGIRVNPNACFHDAHRFSLLFGGHTYGGMPGGSDMYPSRNLMTTMGSMLESVHPCAMVLLGDTIRWAYDPKAVMLYDWFVHGVPVPVFVAPGNHDSMVFGPQRYFRVPFFYEVVMSDHTKLLICNGDRTKVVQSAEVTIVDDSPMGFIGEEQLEFLRVQLETTTQEMIVVAFHRCVWSEFFPIVWQHVNAAMGYRPGEWAKVEMLLQAARARGKKLLVTGGDIGMYWTLSAFYGEHNGIHYMSTGMADWEMDAVVALEIDERAQSFQFQVFSAAPEMRGLPMRPMQHYNETLWTRYFDKVKEMGAAKKTFSNLAKARFFHLGEDPL